MSARAQKFVGGVPLSAKTEYGIWRGIIQRCTNPNHSGFRHYGGRGIAVCDRWRESFAAFYADVGERPSPIHSIDRIDVNGHYESTNVRWATPEQQSSNRRIRPSLQALRFITCDGQVQFHRWLSETGVTQLALARQLGVYPSSIHQWLTGGGRPEHHMRLCIQRIAGIPADDWMTDAEFVIAFGHPRPAS